MGDFARRGDFRRESLVTGNWRRKPFSCDFASAFELCLRRARAPRERCGERERVEKEVGEGAEMEEEREIPRS